jgi:anti-anti-sigma factor
VDHANAAALQAALEPYLPDCKPGGYRIVLDLSRLNYISSAGLRILMITARQVKSQQGVIAVAAMQPVVREIFDISKFTFVLPCFDSVAEALA